MEQILIFATVLAPIILALFELVKRTMPIRTNLIPLAALIIGLFIGAIATPFTDLTIVYRLWAGAFAGLSAVGLFEVGNKTTKGEGQ